MNNEEYIKVVFLDIDGVMNSECSMYEYYELHGHDPSHTDLPCLSAVKNLNRILDSDPNIRIVLSSTWRIIGGWPYVEKILILSGMRNGLMIGATPDMRGSARGLEIQAWMDEYAKRTKRPGEPISLNERYTYGPIKSFVILDDDSDMEHLMSNFVQTDGAWGLTKEDAEKAIEVLNG